MGATNTHTTQTPADTVITVRRVSKWYGDVPVLIDVDFSVTRGTIVGIIGPNGSGKTTLLTIVLGFDRAYTGEVVVHQDERIAYIPQFARYDGFSLPLSVEEFIRIGAAPLYSGAATVSDQTIVTSLEHVGLNASYLSRNVYTLSGGERQRVFIARALLSNPTLLVFDEPLASVDYEARASLYELLRHLQSAHNLTLLIVSHDVESITAVSDTVLCLNKTLQSTCIPTTPIHHQGHTHDTIAPFHHI